LKVKKKLNDLPSIATHLHIYKGATPLNE